MAVKQGEHAEHAEHAAEHGSKKAALLIAVFAAALAICEQQAKHAEISVGANAVLAADTWNQYQAKSIRQTLARDLERVLSALDPPAQDALVARREDVVKALKADQERYEDDPKDGKKALSEKARLYETVRDTSVERSHTFDNAAASLELGIVLATASVITAARHLLRFAMLMGAIGVTLGLFGWLAPELVAI